LSLKNQEKAFFTTFLAEKPKWLTWTEWKTLRFFYSHDADENIILNRVAGILVESGRRIKNINQGYVVALKSLRSGRAKIRAKMKEQEMAAKEEEHKPTKPPWWTYDK
jgi:hypothetical protein